MENRETNPYNKKSNEVDFHPNEDIPTYIHIFVISNKMNLIQWNLPAIADFNKIPESVYKSQRSTLSCY